MSENNNELSGLYIIVQPRLRGCPLKIPIKIVVISAYLSALISKVHRRNKPVANGQKSVDVSTTLMAMGFKETIRRINDKFNPSI